MIDVQTTFAGADIDASGTVFIKVRNEIVINGEVLHSIPHRFPIEPEADFDKEMQVLDAHLLSIGFKTVPAKSVAMVKSVRTLVLDSEKAEAIKR